MAKYNNSYTEIFVDPSDLLQVKGALIKIEVSPTKSLKAFLIKQGQGVPSSVIGWGIVDTGASTTCVNKSTLEKIGGKPIGSTEVITPGKLIELDLYPAKISFPGRNIVRDFDEALAMTDIEIEHEGLPIIAFLGREVLSNCVFIYNGKTGEYSLES